MPTAGVWQRMKKLAYLLVLVPVVAGGWLVRDRATFDRAAWHADYLQLRAATEQSYANLRWTRSAKKVDLVALNTQALTELAQAPSHSAARRALATFINGFHDGHFHLESGPPKPIAAILDRFARAAETRIDFNMSGAAACTALGYQYKNHQLTIDGATSLPGTTFAAGTVTTPGGTRFGIIRIPLFKQYEYGSECERAWAAFRSARGGECDVACQDEFGGVAKHALAQALADDARALQRAGARGVIIDLTGNGGGTEWAEYAAAALSGKPLNPPAVAFIRGKHWQHSFSSEVSALDARLKTITDESARALLLKERTNLLAMIDSAQVACDLQALWQDQQAQPNCWNTVLATPSLLPHARFRFDRPYDGPLYIMTDRHTASASEQFAAMLQDNGVARTIGQQTMGVGCGFTNGGNPITLKHSGLVIWMPDCARVRRDGSNEFEGIKPDYLVDWGPDQATKTAALLSTLDKLPKP
jgi:hypothetical protein